MNWIPWISVLTLLFVAIAVDLVPRLSRPDIFFAVTVPSEFRKSLEGRAIEHRYHTQVWIHSAIALALPVAAMVTGRGSFVLWGILWLSAGSTIAFVLCSHAARPFAVSPTSTREAMLVPRNDGLPGGWLAALGPLLVLGATAIFVHLNWDALPDRLPRHWGIDGQPNGWIYKTPASVYGFLGSGAVVCAVMYGIGLAILRSRRITLSGEAGARETEFRRLNLVILVGTAYFLSFLFSGLFLVPVVFGSSAIGTFNAIVGVFLVLSIGWLIYRMMQFSSKYNDAGDSTPVGDRTPDACWHWGMIYFNRNDPAVVVEKRFGFGYTINMARPTAWLLMTGLLLLPLILSSLR